ncbi:hypothetical protein TWF192_011394 [Orbilia oligospora]|uniref:Uncharacterized protein n=1 Tax=Orbilia oligospora TaxID=2813651 RepID=A0A6G1LXN8_ORBOL|nr:hypothetical protein TWF679_010499 [Orbilia oligospora]KAF3231685.1 hypothetical protein TWF191_005745 [Orbilia oligospora]KAF3236560.1 hypothetical protein TWF192_011394 [Orbilia oligospora]
MERRTERSTYLLAQRYGWSLQVYNRLNDCRGIRGQRTTCREFRSSFFSRGGGSLSHAGEFVTTIAVQLANRSKPLKNYMCEPVEADQNIASQAPSSIQILHHPLKGTQEDEDKKTLTARFRQAVGTIVILSEPLSAAALAGLLGVNQDVIHWSLRHLHSILNVPKDQDSDIRLLHPSFWDFLLDEKGCHDPQFWIDKEMAHQQLAACCHNRLSCSHSGLKLDICNLKHSGTSIEEIDPSLATKIITPEIGPSLSDFLKDAHQFILYNLSMIKQSPLQVYCYALIFTDQTSLIRKKFTDEMQYWIKSVVTKYKYTRLIQVLESDGLGLIQSLVSSPNGKIIASVSPIHRAVVILWDTATGAELQAIDTEDEWIKVIAFSADSKSIVSVSHTSQTILVWNIVTGTVVSRRRLFENLTENQKAAIGRINDIFISADGNLVAVLSKDRGLHLCNTETGSFLLTLERYSPADEIVVEPVGISTSSKMIESGLEKTLRTTYKYSYTGIILWDTMTGAILRVLRSEGIQFDAGALAFSPNGEKLASVIGFINEVKLWDIATGDILRARTPTGDIYTLSFSPSGKTVALGGRVIKLWGIEADTLLKVNNDNRGVVRCLAFSPDSKAFVSTTTTEPKIWLWDIASMNDAVPQETEVHKSDVNIVVISPHGTMIASTGLNKTVRLWDAKMCTALRVHQCEFEDVKVIKFLTDSEAVAYGTNLGSCVILAWSLVTGTFQVVWKVGGYRYENITSIAVSPNNKMIAYASEDGTIRLWDRTTVAALQTLRGIESYSKRSPSRRTRPIDYMGLWASSIFTGQ